MSSTLIETSPHADVTTTHDAAESRGEPTRDLWPWKWMLFACLLLGISGGWRAWRDHQFARLSTETEDCPFPLAELPKTLGPWTSDDKSEQKLDPEIAKTAGSTDHLIRTYVDSRTGDKVTVLLLYGLARNVFGHTPEVCYPASGYQAVSNTDDRPVKVEPELSKPAIFRSRIYLQHLGPGKDLFSEVWYSFRHGNSWKPNMAGDWKTFRYQPGMFKIQTSREVSAAAASPDAPKSTVSESLVELIVKDLEQRIAATHVAPEKKLTAPPVNQSPQDR